MKRYSDDGKLYTDQRRWYGTTEVEEWRGPHEGKALRMMLDRVKPVAYVLNSDYQLHWRQYVDMGVFFSFQEDHDNWLVCLPSETNRLKMVHAEFKRPRTMRSHARLGILFGYTKEHIKAFLNDDKVKAQVASLMERMKAA